MNRVSIYDNVDQHDGKRLSIDQIKFIDKCVLLAKRSALTHKHGCVIVNNRTNTIVGTGYNKKVTNYSNTNSIHAEVDAIKSVKSKAVYNKDSYDMYIIRLGSKHGYEIKYSKPCVACTKLILNKCNNIKKVYYTINTNHDEKD